MIVYCQVKDIDAENMIGMQRNNDNICWCSKISNSTFVENKDWNTLHNSCNIDAYTLYYMLDYAEVCRNNSIRRVSNGWWSYILKRIVVCHQLCDIGNRNRIFVIWMILFRVYSSTMWMRVAHKMILEWHDMYVCYTTKFWYLYSIKYNK